MYKTTNKQEITNLSSTVSLTSYNLIYMYAIKNSLVPVYNQNTIIYISDVRFLTAFASKSFMNLCNQKIDGPLKMSVALTIIWKLFLLV